MNMILPWTRRIQLSRMCCTTPGKGRLGRIHFLGEGLGKWPSSCPSLLAYLIPLFVFNPSLCTFKANNVIDEYNYELSGVGKGCRKSLDPFLVADCTVLTAFFFSHFIFVLATSKRPRRYLLTILYQEPFLRCFRFQAGSNLVSRTYVSSARYLNLYDLRLQTRIDLTALPMMWKLTG